VCVRARVRVLNFDISMRVAALF